METEAKTIDVRPKHICISTSKEASLCCIDEYGVVRTDNYDYCLLLHLGFEHYVLFTYCECEPLVVTMVRAHLWSSSPQRPNIAFTFDLLDWTEALLLECQVALKDLCKALLFRNTNVMLKV